MAQGANDQGINIPINSTDNTKGSFASVRKQIKLLEKEIESIDRTLGGIGRIALPKNVTQGMEDRRSALYSQSEALRASLSQKQQGSNRPLITRSNILPDDLESQVSTVLTSMKKNVQSFGSSISNDLKQARFESKQLVPQNEYKQIQKRFTQLGKTVQGSLMPPIKRWRLATRVASKDMLIFNKSTMSNFRAMRASLGASTMAFLFFGMAIQRVLSSIWRSSTKVFQDVMHSVDGTVTGFDMLQGSMSYLGFTIGAALEPIAMWLAPIIAGWAEWVSENEELVRKVFIIGAALAAVMIIGGQLGLTFLGLASLFATFGLKGAVIAGMFGKMKVALTAFGVVVKSVLGISAAAFSPLLVAIALIIAILAVLVAAWKTNFGNIQGFIKNTFGILWETIKSVFGNIVKIFQGVVMILKGIFTGDFDLIMQGFVKIIVNTISLIVKIFLGLGAIIYNIFAFAFNIIRDGFYNTVKVIIGAMRSLIIALNRIPGVNISTQGLDSALNALEEAKQGGRAEYLTGEQISSALGVTDKVAQWLEQKASGTPKTDQTIVLEDRRPVMVLLDSQLIAEKVADPVAQNIYMRSGN